MAVDLDVNEFNLVDAREGSNLWNSTEQRLRRTLCGVHLHVGELDNHRAIGIRWKCEVEGTGYLVPHSRLSFEGFCWPRHSFLDEIHGENRVSHRRCRGTALPNRQFSDTRYKERKVGNHR